MLTKFGCRVCFRYRDRFWKKPLFDCLKQIRLTLDRVYGEGKVSQTSAAIRWLYHHSKLTGSSGGKLASSLSKENRYNNNDNDDDDDDDNSNNNNNNQ